MLAYYGTRLSPHMDKTPEGYLICRDVPIARTGVQEYLAEELRLDGDPERIVTVNRYPEDVFDPAALASFEGKDVTRGHPPEDVSPENFSYYSRGHVQNVRKSGEYIIADLIIKDAILVSEVWNGATREVSCGYTCQYVPDGDGYRQTNIRGNHVAVVPRGRAGHEVAIRDAAREAEKGRKHMGKFAKTVLDAFGNAAREAETDQELRALAETAASVLDAAPAEVKQEVQPESRESEAAAPTADARCANGDKTEEKSPKWDDLGSRLDKLIEMLGSLQHREEKLHDEKTIDAMVERLTGDSSVTIPAGEAPAVTPASRDAAVGLLRAMRPAVAAIRDEKERSRVVDALLSAVKGPDMVGDVINAAAANARKAADAAGSGTFEARCRESEAAYAARNPHRRKEN